MNKLSRSGHRPMFPPYISDIDAERNLAILVEGRLIDTKGRIYEYASPGELRDVIFRENFMVFIQDLKDAWFRDYAEVYCDNDSDDVLSNRNGDFSSIRLSLGKRKRWIALAKNWGEVASVAFIVRLARFFEWIGVGCFHTPGALGFALTRRSWRLNNLGFHGSPGLAACEYIKEHENGGRVDTPGLYSYNEWAMEYDQGSAFTAKNRLLPDKTAVVYDTWPEDKYFTWFGKCTLRINSELALGPVPKRQPDGHLTYPTLPGYYTDCYIWKEQWIQALEAGADIRCEGGVGWLGSTTDTEPLCTELYYLKMNAPQQYMSDYIKKVMVSTIGRYGMTAEMYKIITERTATDEDEPIWSQGVATRLYIRKEINKRAVPMPHWFTYTSQLVAVETYGFALPFAKKGLLIATNMDSVITLDDTVVPNTVRKHSAEAYVAEAGTWNYELLEDLYIPAPRAKTHKHGKIRPGVKRNETSKDCVLEPEV